MRKETVTLPPGHYIIADPRYFNKSPRDGLPDTFFGVAEMGPSMIILKIVTMLILAR